MSVNRALIIRTVGDPATANAIAQGMTAHIIPLTSAELETVKAERDALRAYYDVHSYGAGVRSAAACEALADKYTPREHGRLYWAILTPWALLWYGLACAVDALDRYMAAWR